MEEDWTNTTDPKERKKIQNRVAQRAHREKLKSRIRQLEEQLETVQNEASKQQQQQQQQQQQHMSSYDDPMLSFAMPGVLPTPTSECTSDRSRTGSSEISISGDHTSRLLLGSDMSIESTFNTIQHGCGSAAHLDPISWAPGEDQNMDIDWLLTDPGTLKPLLERTQAHSSGMEGHENPDHSQSPSSTSRTLPPMERPRNGRKSSQSAQKPTATSTSQKPQTPGQNPIPISDGTRLERLSLLEECGRRLGFSNLTEALSVYYTFDPSKSKSAVLSHEQSLNRVRRLPNFLSSIREHSKHWPSWERTNYVRETLRSAEDIYAEECKLARINLRDQGFTGLTSKESQGDQVSQITRVLQQEIPETWALISGIILHTIMPGESQQPQIILMVMVLLCYRSQDPMATLGLCQKYLC